MSVFWDDGRNQLELFCNKTRKPSSMEASPFNYFIHPDPDQMLRVEIGLGFRRARLKNVYSILRGKDLDTEEFSEDQRELQFYILREAQEYTLDLQNWHEFLKILLRAGYKSSQMISSQMAILFAQTFYLIGKRDFKVDTHNLRNVIARWFFMTSLTGRYSSSPESEMEKELTRLRDVSTAILFINMLDRIIDDVFTDDYWKITLPNELATSSARSPALFAYYAALNLLDARALFSELKISELLDPSSKSYKAALERHHLFPKAYLNSIGISEIRETNQIANYALVEWSDNIQISDSSPGEYWPKYKVRLKSDDLKQMSYWHALPDNWEKMDYFKFLSSRRIKIANIIKNGFSTLNTDQYNKTNLK